MTAWARASRLKAKIKSDTPGRPSGVWSGSSRPSIAASALQAITLVAKPVAWIPAVSAHSADTAVTITRVPTIVKASANVSAIATPLCSKVSIAVVCSVTGLLAGCEDAG